MKERKWWNGVPRVPSLWWRSSSVPPRQESDDQPGQHRTSPKIREEPVAEECNKAQALPESPDGVTPDAILRYSKTDTEPRCSDDVLVARSGRHSLDASDRVTGKDLRNSVPRALSTPPRRRKEFVLEGIPDISFSFFNDQAVPVTSASEACLQTTEQSSRHSPSRAEAQVMDTFVTSTGVSAVIVGEDVKTPSQEGDYEVLRTVIPVNSTPADAVQISMVAVLSQEQQSKKSPNISCINIVSINTAAQHENQYASPRNSSSTTEVSDLSSPTPQPNVSSIECTSPYFQDSSIENPSLDAPSPDCATPPCQDTPAASTITISLPLQLTDQAVTGCHDWETITDYSDYYDITSVCTQRRKANSDYEDVQQGQNYCTPRGRRATLMRDRRRGMGTMRTRIRRAWRAVRGWLGEERVRIGGVIQRHAHAQAVRKSEDIQQAEEEDSRVVVVRTREGSSRPTSRTGPRRSRHFPEVKPFFAIVCFFRTRCAAGMSCFKGRL
ncbi:hypothetical protein B7P43_G00330 [Cryptotermes secundus]|uniref:Uncharacterized protein n=1 Tax=Cryptotermes secundus TaxID=105785 RepID=A0A2J7QVI9_9NEOP|nr:hypothetical protein B7P43_G00330 [Cryptotermes secundus]